MELLQFEVTNAGTLGGRWTPPAPETKKASSLPGAALAALLQEETTRMIGAAMLPT